MEEAKTAYACGTMKDGAGHLACFFDVSGVVPPKPPGGKAWPPGWSEGSRGQRRDSATGDARQRLATLWNQCGDVIAWPMVFVIVALAYFIYRSVFPKINKGNPKFFGSIRYVRNY